MIVQNTRRHQMTKKEREEKIKALTAAKDKVEQGLALLRHEGYSEYNQDYKSLKKGILGIRTDITGLQTGDYPYATITE